MPVTESFSIQSVVLLRHGGLRRHVALLPCTATVRGQFESFGKEKWKVSFSDRCYVYPAYLGYFKK